MSEFSDLPFNLPQKIETGPNQALPIGGGRGVCASFYSPDDLDLKSVKFIENFITEHKQTRVADLGCSPYFPQAIRFARMGAEVDAFDIEKSVPEYDLINKKLNNKVNYIQTNFSNSFSVNMKYNLIYANRFFSHLPFHRAQEIINTFYTKLSVGGRMYFSFSSLNSDLAKDYKDLQKSVELRYCNITNTRTNKNQIACPMCLYLPEEVTGNLVKALDLKLIEMFESKSGSIKVIFEK